MALIQTIDEIKALLPRLVSNLSDESLLPNFARAGQKYLVPLVGQQLYAEMVDAYETSLSPDEEALLPHMQLVVCAYAFADELAYSHAKITDSGVRTLSTQQAPGAKIWEYRELRTSLLETAADGVENMLALLLQQKPAAWVSSEPYKQISRLLIRTGTEFDAIEKLHQPLRTFWTIKACVADAQLHYLATSLGSSLLDYLRDKATPAADEILILDFLKKALAHYTLVHAVPRYSGRFDSNGFTITSLAETPEGAAGRFDGQLLDLKLREHEVQGRTYLNRALNACYDWYQDAGADADYKTAFEAGPLVSYLTPDKRDKGNARRNIFRL